MHETVNESQKIYDIIREFKLCFNFNFEIFEYTGIPFPIQILF